MHEINPDESSEFEWAADECLSGLRHAQY